VSGRRRFLEAAAAVPVAAAFGHLARAEPRGQGAAPGRGAPRVVVVGAGAFGGWTALHLRRAGAQVTLLDAWGPGNSRASSGGETRVIRGTYGAARVYVELVARSFEIWQESESRWRRKLYFPTGALWMVGRDDTLVAAARPILRELGFPFETLAPAAAMRRWPQVSFEGVREVHYETREAVAEAFVAEGGEYKQAAVRTATLGRGPLRALELARGPLRALELADGARVEADAFVFACGPWLGGLFPDVLGDLVRPSRQEVFFFGAPAGDARFSEERLPVWVDLTEGLVYGIPGNERRGFKVADDAHGPAFDPTAGERLVSAEGLRWARAYVGRRFPALRGAPLLESRVCQYENSPDSNLILDRHPSAPNVWLVGGGSGHGFKFGPALGERVALAVLDRRPPDAAFALARFVRGSPS
jgi:glycine/D-amino acid oxidase-like deaminating enzyme